MDGCPMFAPAYMGRKRRGEAPRLLSIFLQLNPHTPGFRVKRGWVNSLHAAFLNESRTRGTWLALRTGSRYLARFSRDVGCREP